MLFTRIAIVIVVTNNTSNNKIVRIMHPIVSQVIISPLLTNHPVVVAVCCRHNDAADAVPSVSRMVPDGSS